MTFDKWNYSGRVVALADMEHLTIGLIAVVIREEFGQQIAALPLAIEALLPFAQEWVTEDAICHRGICTMQECGRCGRILKARQAIEAYTGSTQLSELVTWDQPPPPARKTYCPKGTCGKDDGHEGDCDTDFDDIPF